MRHHCLPNKREQGVVIIVALFVVALVATIAYLMMSRLERDTNRTTMILRNTQAELYAQGSIAWAVDQLITNMNQQKPNKPVDNLPLKAPTNTVNGYIIDTTIFDMQARFNLNELTNPQTQNSFKNMLKVLLPDMNDNTIQAITLAIIDWVSTNQTQNELTKYYLELPEPYRPAHRPFQSASELQLVKGITPAIYSALQPYVTALPTPAPINIQTASLPVLMSISPDMTVEIAKALMQARIAKPFTNIDQLSNNDIIKNNHIPTDGLTVVSQYFLVETSVAIENQRALIYTLLYRVQKDNASVVTIIWQSKGIW